MATGIGWEGTLLAKAVSDPTQWKCTVCSVKNKEADLQCVACESPKPGTKVAAPAPAASASTSFGFTPSVSTNGAPAPFAFTPASTAPVSFGFTPVSSGPVTFGFTPVSTAPVTFGVAPSASAAPSAPSSSSTGSAEKKEAAPSVAIEKPDLARTVAGNVYVVGTGDCDQLGLGEDVMEVTKPKKIPDLEAKDIVQVAAGGLHSLALTYDGKIWSWGCNDDKALGREGVENVPHQITAELDHIPIQVSCGDCHSVALTRDGLVYAWGSYKDNNGYIGFSPKIKKQDVPMLIEGLPTLSPVEHVVSGAHHSLALLANGEVYAWGSGEQGQLGHRVISRHKIESSLRPRRLTLPSKRSKTKITAVYCTSYSTFLVTSAKEVYAIGLNNRGQLGIGSYEDQTTPVLVESLEGKTIISLAGGEHHAMALDSEGTVYTAGKGDYGQLGHGNIDNSDVFKPVEGILKNIKIRSISAGGNHCLAVSESGELYAWGYGEMLQLGNGDAKDELTPVRVDSKQLAGKYVLQASGGGQHSVMLAWEKGLHDFPPLKVEMSAKPLIRKRQKTEKDEDEETVQQPKRKRQSMAAVPSSKAKKEEAAEEEDQTETDGEQAAAEKMKQKETKKKRGSTTPARKTKTAKKGEDEKEQEEEEEEEEEAGKGQGNKRKRASINNNSTPKKSVLGSTQNKRRVAPASEPSQKSSRGRKKAKLNQE